MSRKKQFSPNPSKITFINSLKLSFPTIAIFVIYLVTWYQCFGKFYSPFFLYSKLWYLSQFSTIPVGGVMVKQIPASAICIFEQTFLISSAKICVNQSLICQKHLYIYIMYVHTLKNTDIKRPYLIAETWSLSIILYSSLQFIHTGYIQNYTLYIQNF